MEADPVAQQDGALARALEALASVPRLSLLRQLQTPRILREIRVRSSADDDRAGSISRQAIREHLDRLLEIGVIHARETERDHGGTIEYMINHQALFALAEEFRALAKLKPHEEPNAETVRAPAPSRPAEVAGPSLVLVHGLDEGRRFDLTPGPSRQTWTIGRRRGTDVPIDFDPFASSHHARIDWRDGAHWLTDLEDSRNGTTLNFREIPKATPVRLAPADIIGVGRTLFVFRA
ncbi:MAG: hypothetical protein QOE90_1088 [Thermoplasmata archaeon]|nr:hypothetical protein [Thermoplasmata archaeon]